MNRGSSWPSFGLRGVSQLPSNIHPKFGIFYHSVWPQVEEILLVTNRLGHVMGNREATGPQGQP